MVLAGRRQTDVSATAAEFDQRELAFHKMTEGGITQPLGSRLEMFDVFFVGRMNRLARYVGRKDDRSCNARTFFTFRLVRPSGSRRLLLLLLLLMFLGSLNVTLQEGCGLLINVQRKTVVRPLAVVTVNARRHSVRHDVFANPLQLVLRAIFQVQKGLQADLFALSLSIIGPASQSECVRIERKKKNRKKKQE